MACGGLFSLELLGVWALVSLSNTPFRGAAGCPGLGGGGVAEVPQPQGKPASALGLSARS